MTDRLEFRGKWSDIIGPIWLMILAGIFTLGIAVPWAFISYRKRIMESFTSRLCPAVPRSGAGCLLCSSLKLLNLLALSRCSALPFATAPVLWPRLTPAISICFLKQVYRLRLDHRSPQVSSLTFPAHLSNLLLRPLVVWGFVVVCQLARPHSLLSVSCSSSRRFASAFLQTSLRSDALAFG